MLNELWADWLRFWGGLPCFRIYGKARPERLWRIIEVYATSRRNLGSGWPLWDGTCVTWSAEIIAVGWDFAESVLREQSQFPASRQNPVEVTHGRIRGEALRKTSERAAVARHSVAVNVAIPASATEWRPTASQVLAHECGHTWQALRLHSLYLPFVGAVTLFREGPHPWNRFENQASELGQFGGIVNGSVCKELMKAVASIS